MQGTCIDINKKCLPFIFKEKQSKDIVSWYYNKFVNKKEINVIFHNNIDNTDIKIDSLIVKSGNLFDINGFTIKKNMFFLFSSIRILIIALVLIIEWYNFIIIIYHFD